MSDDIWDKWDGRDAEPSEGRGKYGRAKKEDPGHDIPNVTVLRTTGAGILVRGAGLTPDPFNMNDQEQEEWFPLSQMHERSEVRNEGDVGTLVISAWLASKKGLI